MNLLENEFTGLAKGILPHRFNESISHLDRAELKAYACEVQAEQWLFAGKDRRQPIHAATVQKAAKRAYA